MIVLLTCRAQELSAKKVFNQIAKEILRRQIRNSPREQSRRMLGHSRDYRKLEMSSIWNNSWKKMKSERGGSPRKMPNGQKNHRWSTAHVLWNSEFTSSVLDAIDAALRNNVSSLGFQSRFDVILFYPLISALWNAYPVPMYPWIRELIFHLFRLFIEESVPEAQRKLWLGHFSTATTITPQAMITEFSISQSTLLLC